MDISRTITSKNVHEKISNPASFSDLGDCPLFGGTLNTKNYTSLVFPYINMVEMFPVTHRQRRRLSFLLKVY